MIARAFLLALSLAACSACGDEASRPVAAPPAPWQPSAKAVSANSADGTYAASWEPEGTALPDAEPFNMRFAVRRADGRAISAAARMSVDAEMPHHGHGMNLVPTVTRLGAWNGSELLVASGMLLHMPGRWVLSLDIEEDGVLERTQWFIDVE